MKELITKYIKALADMVNDLSLLEEIRKELNQVWEILKSDSKLYLFLKVPHIAKEEKFKLIDLISYEFQYHHQLNNFLKLLVLNDRIEILDQLITELAQYLNQEQGLKIVQLELPYEIDNKALKEMEELLKEKLATNLKINLSINKNLVFGFRIWINSDLYDYSFDSLMSHFKKSLRELSLS